MRKLLWILAMALLPSAAHAACTALTPGNNAAQIQAAVNACATAGGGTVLAPAGSYSVTSTITLPCNVTLSGPVLPFSQTHYQTAIFNGSSSFSGLPIHTTAGCSSSQAIEYLEWNGQHPTNGGGFIYVTSGTTNLVINNNFIHGSNAAAYAENTNEGGVVLDGVTGGPVTQNVTINLNEFGPESLVDCGYPGGAMGETDTEGGGGFCAGVLMLGQTKNVTITNNWFHNLEQGNKIIEASSGHGNSQLFTMEKNSYTGISRIDFETQSNLGDTSKPTFQNIRWNYLGDRAPNGQFNFDLSIANGCGSALNCTAHMDYNIDIQASSTNGRGGGNEFWGDRNSTGNSNWFEGYVAKAIGGVITWSQTGQFNFNNNIFNVFKGGNTDCTVGSSGYWSKESGNSPAFSPTCTGNSFSTVGSGTITSQSPTISPNGGIFSGSQLVTLACPTCTLRETNTSIWYTTDGSTPVAGTSKLYTAPFTVSAATTVKAIGMWGGLNQPYSYPAGYGYVPSSAVSATFTPGTSFNCAPGGFTTTNTPCGVGGLISGSGSAFKVIGSQNGATPAVSGGNVVIANSGITHFALTLMNQTPQTVSAFSTTFTFIPNGQNIALMFNNCANNGATGVGTCGGFNLANFSSGASCEGDFYQEYSPNPFPYNVFALMFDSYAPLSSGSFTYSSAQIYQQNQSPCNPNPGGPIVQPYWSTTKFSTSPVALNSPAASQGTTTGHTYSATVTYDGSTVTLNLYDVTAGGSCPGASCFTKTWSNVSIPSQVNGTTAYVGIGGSTGAAATGNLVVTGWTWTPSTPTASPSSTVTAAGSPTAVNPSFSPVAGGYSGTQNVTITAAGSSNICYAVGSPGLVITPIANQLGGCAVGTLYTSPVAISSTQTLYAVAGLNGTGTSSGVVQGLYTIGGATPVAATPVLTPGTESFYVSASVALSSSTPSSTIYYTTNGTTPTTASPVYTAPITVTSTTTIQAMATAAGFTNSAIGSGTYTLSIPPLTSCNQQNTGSVNSVAVGGAIQQFTQCVYSASGETLTCSPGADKYGNVATLWGASNGNITVGAIGNAPGCGAGLNGPGCVTGITAGTANSTASVGAKTCNVWGWTVTNSPPTLLSATVTLQGGGTAVNVGSSVQGCANMFYTGSISTQLCGTGTDAYGTVVSNWTSSDPTKATMVSTTGVLTGVAAGPTNAGVTAGSMHPSLAVSVNTPITGVNVQIGGARISGAKIQ